MVAKETRASSAAIRSHPWWRSCRERVMFTLLSIWMTVSIARRITRIQDTQDVRDYSWDDEPVSRCLYNIRQDLRFACFLLSAVIRMLGILADVVVFAPPIR